MIGLKAVWMQHNIASATPVEGTAFAVLVGVFPFRSLDHKVRPIVPPDVCQSNGGEGWKCVDTAGVVLTMEHCHFHTRWNEAQERHLFIVLDDHHHSHLTIQTPGLNKRDIQKSIVQRQYHFRLQVVMAYHDTILSRSTPPLWVL